MWWTHERETASSHEDRKREKQAQAGGFGTLTEGSGQMLLEIRSSTGMWNHPLHLDRCLHSLHGALRLLAPSQVCLILVNPEKCHQIQFLHFQMVLDDT